MNDKSRKQQAEAWVKVFELCLELGMPIGVAGKSGEDSVLDFIRGLYTANTLPAPLPEPPMPIALDIDVKARFLIRVQQPEGEF